MVKEAREDGYFAYPRSFLKKFPTYTLAAKCLYTFLYGAAYYLGEDKGEWRGSIRELAAQTGMDKDSVQRAIKELVDGEDLIYTPSRSRHQPSEFEIVNYMTAKDYQTGEEDSEQN